MSAPQAISDPDLNVRTHSLIDLERVLRDFLSQVFGEARLDNPAVNALQPGTVPFDYVERAQSLSGKVPPRVVCGRVPRTLTGEIDVDQLPDYPSIAIQAVSADVDTDDTQVTVRILFNAYDESPDSQGYQDVLNLMEAASIALTSWGQRGLDDAYPIVMPIKWKLLELGTFPHFIGEMTTMWQLPSARPLPGPDECFIPGEHIDFGLTHMDRGNNNGL